MANSILFLSFVLVLPFVCSIQFNISRFGSDTSEIAYQGDATANGAVELTNIDYTCRAGWATYGTKVPLWDPEIAPPAIQLPPNSAGGFLGLFNETNVKPSSFPLVHVEFDTFSNDEWDPLDVKSHVGINNNSLFPLTTLLGMQLHTAKLYAVLSYIIDLSKVLPSEVTVGFSATSGSVTEGYRLLSWDFSSSLEPRDIKKFHNDSKGMIIGFSISGFVLLIFLIVSLIVFLKRKQQKKKAEETANLMSINEDLERGAGPRKFTYKELASAANNFSDDRKLGEGGFGAVYKGVLKRLRYDGGGGRGETREGDVQLWLERKMSF
ncbi:L-type lectin-domain containing receptor kinase IX.1 [Cardamine amara subsp. amara]|uniref:L-type lectin-domain containing receptor kinase IX.1 n=1 Tax=Cardamine amara subsp. amara TaxID=228776 RepID=A0ABD1AQK2_CARAN